MKPIANYHTHTFLCHHGKDKPIDYVRQAVKEGCLELGFSDHCPYPPSFEDTWPHVRMTQDEVPIYFDMIEEAKAEAYFPVYKGFECEWDKRYKSWYEELKAMGAQYLVLGQHWITEGSRHLYGTELTDNKLLCRYTDQTIDGMRSGLFAFLAHPDLLMRNRKEWDDNTESCLSAILDAAIDLQLPIEVNGLGITRTPNNTERGMRYMYPYVEFWEMVKEKGDKVKILCNSDAHESTEVIMNAWRARDFAGRFNLKIEDKCNL